MAQQQVQQYERTFTYPVGTMYSVSSSITNGMVVSDQNKTLKQEFKSLTQRPSLGLFTGTINPWVSSTELILLCQDIKKTQSTSSAVQKLTLIVTRDTGNIARYYILTSSTSLSLTDATITYIGSTPTTAPGANVESIDLLDYPFDNQYVYVTLGSSGYLVKIDIGALTLSTVAYTSFDPGVKLVGTTELDGYAFYLNTDNRIYNSTPGVYQTVLSTDYITPESFADTAIFLGRIKNYLVAVSTNSIEFFYTTTQVTGSPLAPAKEYVITSDSPILRGSVAIINDVIFFATRDGFYKVEGFKLSSISSIGFNASVQGTLNSVYLYAQGFSVADKAFYSIIKDTSSMWVYDITEDIWYIWSGFNFSYTRAIFAGRVQSISRTGIMGYVDSGVSRIRLRKFNILTTQGGWDETTTGNNYFTTSVSHTNIDLGEQKLKVIKEIDLVPDTSYNGYAAPTTNITYNISLVDGDSTTRTITRTLSYSPRYSYFYTRKLGSWMNPKLSISFSGSTTNATRVFIKEVSVSVITGTE